MTTVGVETKQVEGEKGAEQPSLPDSLWVVIPAYNEVQRIGAVLDELLRYAKNIVVADDASRDATEAEVLKRPVVLLKHLTNLGQGAALQTGITYALSQGASYVVTFDADGQHSPSDIPVMFRELTARAADFALGSRFLGDAKDIPRVRRAVLRLAVLFTRLLSGVSLSDTHNGIRIMSRTGGQAIRITLNRMEHASEIIEQISASGLPYIEVPVTIKYSADCLEKGQKTSAAIKLGLKLLVEKLLR